MEGLACDLTLTGACEAVSLLCVTTMLRVLTSMVSDKVKVNKRGMCDYNIFMLDH